ncbi:ATP-binding protein [Kitasatospora sp. NPDC048365]|uniref:ATP-binding protein n=1 Tax=Kitasatospora sp. NPDC048365 TaxID=3364050 RepID=UPI00371FCA7B
MAAASAAGAVALAASNAPCWSPFSQHCTALAARSRASTILSNARVGIGSPAESVVDYTAIESKYVGESEKNLKALFAEGERAGAMLVFNEADSLTSGRLTRVDSGSDQAHNNVRNAMLRALEDYPGMVVLTTNQGQLFDRAFRRRIQVTLVLSVPDEPTLQRLWAAKLPDRMPRADDVDAAVLAGLSLGLSGGDLVNAVKLAAFQAASRKGDDRQVNLADLTEALAEVRRTAAAFGADLAAPESDLITAAALGTSSEGKEVETLSSASTGAGQDQSAPIGE